MAEFDPDAYLAEKSQPSGGFDPDAYLGKQSAKPSMSDLLAPAMKTPGVVGPAVASGLAELGKGAGALTELFFPESGQAITKTATELQKLIKEAHPVAGTVGQFGSYAIPYGALSKGAALARGRQATTLGEKALEAAGIGGVLGYGLTPGGQKDRTESAALGAGLGAALPYGVAAAKSGVDVVKRAIGKETSAAARAAQEAAAGRYAEPLARSEAKQAQAERAIEQMERQGKIAAERAGNVPLTAEQQQAKLQAQVREPVRQQMAGRRVTAEQKAEAAKAEADAAQQRLAGAEQAVNQLEQSLIARPGMTADQFGAQLRATVEKLEKDAIANRADAARYGEVLNRRGDEVIVDTTALRDRANEIIRTSRNPQVIAMMEEIRKLAATNSIEGLSLKSADSLRKYLSKDIIKKFFAETGADKETLNALKAMRGELIEKAPQEYKELLGKWSTLSRPLDIVERQGALRKVVDIDPMSTAAKMTEAEVTGQIIRKANAGNPVFTRLLETQPGLKDSARLYFTRDLFGQGAVPTDSALRNWLKTNDRSLRQLGLYEEFNGMKNAKVAAQRAVKETKTEATAATETVSTTEQSAKARKNISEKSAARLEEALKTSLTGKPSAPSKTPIQTFIHTREKAARAISDMQQVQAKISTATKPQEIVKEVTAAAEDMYKRGIIDIDGYNLMRSEMKNVQSMIDAKKKAVNILKWIGGAGGATIGVGYYARRGVESMFD